MKVVLLSAQCVNSKWTARGMGHKGETCQCIVSCKVSVTVEKNGHPPYKYVVTIREYRKLVLEEKDFNNSKNG